MAKYWFGSLELIGEQHDKEGHPMPTTLKAVKGWKVMAKDYPLIHKEKIDEKTRQHWVKNFLPKWFADWIPESTETLTEMEKDRKELSETWWEDAELWWKGQKHNLDLKGIDLDHPTTRELDYVPIRETGDYQLRITGPIEIVKPAKPKPAETAKAKI
jgi:hypothetical protein